MIIKIIIIMKKQSFKVVLSLLANLTSAIKVETC